MSTRDVLNDKEEFAGKIAGNKQIKEYVGKIMEKRDELDQINEDARDKRGEIQSLYTEAKTKGIDNKALKKVIKQMRGDVDSEEHKNTVNAYLKAMGEQPLFSTPASH